MREETLSLVCNDKFVKSILILGFLALTIISLVIMKTPSSQGYEISIYEVYPFYFWILLILSIFIGQIVLLRYALNYNGSQLWIFGVLLIVISNLILLFQPIIRGYAIYGRGDVLTHIGYIKDMLVSGTIGSNPYPLDHIFLLFLNLTSLFKLSDLIILVPVIFSLFFMLSIFLLAKTILKSNDKVIFVLIFASLLLFGNTNSLFSPYTQSLMLFPFVLYLFFKRRDSNLKPEFSIMLLLLVSFITFFHPLSAIILILIFLLIEFFRLLNSQWLTKKSLWITERVSFSNPKFIASSKNVILIALIIFFSWGTYAYLLLKNVDRMVSSFFGEYPSTSQFQSYSEVLNYGQPTIITFIKTVFFTYGQYILLISMSILAIFYIFKLRKSKKLNFYHIFSSTGFLFFILASFFTFISLQVFGFTRMLFISMIFSILLTSILLDRLKKTNSNSNLLRKLKIGFLCLFILSITVFSTFNLYWSPLTKNANQQVSESELGGMKTFFNYRNNSFSSLELGISNYRFFEAIYGKDAKKVNVFYKKRVKSVGVPEHLGYNNNSLFGSAYKSNVYIVLSKLGETTYPELYYEEEFVDKWRFNSDDFTKFSNDPSVNLVYQSGDLKVFFTNKVS